MPRCGADLGMGRTKCTSKGTTSPRAYWRSSCSITPIGQTRGLKGCHVSDPSLKRQKLRASAGQLSRAGRDALDCSASHDHQPGPKDTDGMQGERAVGSGGFIEAFSSSVHRALFGQLIASDNGRRACARAP